MNRAPSGLEALVLFAVVSGPVVLIHELAHAVMAKYVGAKSVDLQAGGSGPTATRNIGGVRAQLAPVARPWRLDGMVTFDPAGISPLGLAMIALAGPVASIATGLVMGSLMTDDGSFVNDVLWTATFSSVGGGLLSLIPMRLVDSLAPGKPGFETDGMVALRAFGYMRAPRTRRSGGHFGAAVGWLMILTALALGAWLTEDTTYEHGPPAVLALGLFVGGVWSLSSSRS